MTDFVLTRVQRDPDVTIGELTIGGHHIAWTCEDTERIGQPKVWGQTCIPRGRYRILRTWSPHFNATWPQVMDVPGFEGIRIHPGNTPADTEGCILPGLERRPKSVGSSQLAFSEVLKWLDSIEQQNQEAWITITGPDVGADEAMAAGA